VQRGVDATAEEGSPVGDAAVLGGVAALLVAVHFLAPEPVRARLAFDYVAFDPLTLVTSAYVHSTDAHLFGNLLGYGIGAVYAYGLCVRRGERAWFRRTSVLLLVALPVLVNLASYVALSVQFPDARPVSRGFSGVVGGFCGFLLVALFSALREEAGVRTATGALLAVCTVAVGVLGVARTPTDPVTPLFVLAGVVLSAVGSGFVVGDPLARLWRRRRDVAEVLLVTLAVALLARSLFPVEPVAGGPLAEENVFAHASGVLFGAAFAAVAARFGGQ
jgi:hypothetical protein